jgi:hypothetical protein
MATPRNNENTLGTHASSVPYFRHAPFVENEQAGSVRTQGFSEK